jgi:hypothetical protein
MSYPKATVDLADIRSKYLAAEREAQGAAKHQPKSAKEMT